jgi:hypothetical protein
MMGFLGRNGGRALLSELKAAKSALKGDFKALFAPKKGP